MRRITSVKFIGSLILGLTAFIWPANAQDTWTFSDNEICSTPIAGEAKCLSTTRQIFHNGAPQVASTPTEFANTLSQLNTAILHANPKSGLQNLALTTSFSGSTIRTAYGITALGDPTKVVAIIDAYDSPNAFRNANVFRSAAGLVPLLSCSSPSNFASLTAPCLLKVNQKGSTSRLPAKNSGWATEIDLDVQAISAICPKCSILLVEANSAGFADLSAAVTYASSLNSVVAISNSFGTSTDVSQATYSAWNVAGTKLPVFASAGDAGWQLSASFPASSSNVIGVGGTTLNVGLDGKRSSETVWNGTGSGCSTLNSKAPWQSGALPCGVFKPVSDVSAVADPATGLAIYTTYNGSTGYFQFGGTSLSSPILASVHALRGGYSVSVLTVAYKSVDPALYFSDVTSGNNGSCSNGTCVAGIGWDGPTGLGSIK